MPKTKKNRLSILTFEPGEGTNHEASLLSQIAAWARPRAFKLFNWSSQDMAASEEKEEVNGMLRFRADPRINLRIEPCSSL